MKLLLILFLFSFSVSAIAKEDCSSEALDFSENEDIEVELFYTGTCHYRNEDYEQSAKNWEKLAAITNINPKHKELQVSVLNNLAYLKFFGLGINKSQHQAIEYWTKAVSLGHIEAEFHLCHAFGDSEQSTFEREKAILHCDKAFLIYNGIEEPDESDKQILDTIKKYRSELDV
jgi:TPR repeat protein